MTTPKAFRFKQFSVQDNMCAMKVGTDAVILGAWAHFDHAGEILDVGTGCGIIALMAAQKSHAHITALDIDENAIEQSKINFSASPWPERFEAIHQPVQQYHSEKLFDVIVCNPPFFRNALKAPNKQRSMARHNDHLSFESLIVSVDRLMSKDGTFVFILPNEEAMEVITMAAAHQLYLKRCCKVIPRDGKVPNRIMAELSRNECCVVEEQLLIRDSNNQYSAQYKALTDAFYLFLH
ncbi:MAG: methyltransferase [Bacteroidota bacterium]|nr:methyltransferase [Bacteroidota bacterium]